MKMKNKLDWRDMIIWISVILAFVFLVVSVFKGG